MFENKGTFTEIIYRKDKIYCKILLDLNAKFCNCKSANIFYIQSYENEKDNCQNKPCCCCNLKIKNSFIPIDANTEFELEQNIKTHIQTNKKYAIAIDITSLKIVEIREISEK